MNFNLTRWFIIAVGVILTVFGLKFGIDAMGAKDWIMGIFSLIGIIVGVGLVAGKYPTVS